MLAYPWLLLSLSFLSAFSPPREHVGLNVASKNSAIVSPLPSPVATRKKLALLIGIDKYKSGEVPLLNGAKNDVQLVKNMLINKFGFQESSIVTLTDKQATTANIIKQFQSHLIKGAQQGDIAVFFFSGHGSQVKDISGDESDLRDETLVTYDSRTDDVFDITDDQVNGLVKLLNNKTENVTLILDACHSGTGAKDIGVAREAPFDNRSPPPPYNWELSEGSKGNKNSFIRDSNNHYTLISGCDFDQRSFETKKNGMHTGVLTYHLTRIVNNTPTSLTYKELHELLKREVTFEKRNQIPQIEGPRLNHLLFSDSISVAYSYLIAQPSDTKVTLEGGLVHGVTMGSVFEIFPPGTVYFKSKNTNPLVRITDVSAFESKASYQTLNKGQIKPGSRAIEKEHFYSASKLTIFFAGNNWNREPYRKLKSLVLSNSFTELTSSENNALITIEANEDIVVRLTEIRNYPGKAFNASNHDQINKQIKEWAKWFNVLSLENPQKTSTGYTQFSMVRPQSDGSKSVDDFDRIGKPKYRFRINDEVNLEIINCSKTDTLNIFILDMDLDGAITTALPAPGEKIILLPGKTWNSLNNDITITIRNAGILKMIATTNRNLNIDFLQTALTENEEISVNKIVAMASRKGSLSVTKNSSNKLDSWTTEKIVFDVDQ